MIESNSANFPSEILNVLPNSQQLCLERTCSFNRKDDILQIPFETSFNVNPSYKSYKNDEKSPNFQVSQVEIEYNTSEQHNLSFNNDDQQDKIVNSELLLLSTIQAASYQQIADTNTIKSKIRLIDKVEPLVSYFGEKRSNLEEVIVLLLPKLNIINFDFKNRITKTNKNFAALQALQQQLNQQKLKKETCIWQQMQRHFISSSQLLIDENTNNVLCNSNNMNQPTVVDFQKIISSRKKLLELIIDREQKFNKPQNPEKARFQEKITCYVFMHLFIQKFNFRQEKLQIQDEPKCKLDPYVKQQQQRLLFDESHSELFSQNQNRVKKKKDQKQIACNLNFSQLYQQVDQKILQAYQHQLSSSVQNILSAANNNSYTYTQQMMPIQLNQLVMSNRQHDQQPQLRNFQQQSPSNFNNDSQEYISQSNQTQPPIIIPSCDRFFQNTDCQKRYNTRSGRS